MSAPTNDGGPAFPVTPPTAIMPEECATRVGGMSMRDWFAGMALQGILANPASYGRNEHETAAEIAYDIASDMIKEKDAK